MAKNNRERNKGRMDAPGGFTAIPHVVTDHPDYIKLSGSATKLLIEIARQLRKENNGDLHATFSLLKNRGFNSTKTLSRSLDELLAARMIVKTRDGRFCNPGSRCALYAVTWRPIDECPGKGLEISPTRSPYRLFSIELKTINEKPIPQNGSSSDHKVNRRRARDGKGKFVSNHKRLRLVDSA